MRDLIQIESVHKTFGAPRRPVHALDNVNLRVREGEFLALIGPSGCGKTTLLKMLADLLTPSAGQIAIDRRTPADARRQRETAVVFQAPTLMEWRTIAQNIALPLEINATARAARAQRVNELLQMIQLAEFSGHYPHQLSAGMQQQVSIARALAYRPKILLMDEPFGALDEMTRERLGQTLLEIWARERVTIIFVTHSISEAVWLADRVAIFSPRPGCIEKTIAIDLPRPRAPATRETPHYLDLVQQVRRALRVNNDWGLEIKDGDE